MQQRGQREDETIQFYTDQGAYLYEEATSEVRGAMLSLRSLSRGELAYLLLSFLCRICGIFRIVNQGLLIFNRRQGRFLVEVFGMITRGATRGNAFMFTFTCGQNVLMDITCAYNASVLLTLRIFRGEYCDYMKEHQFKVFNGGIFCRTATRFPGMRRYFFFLCHWLFRKWDVWVGSVRVCRCFMDRRRAIDWLVWVFLLYMCSFTELGEA